MTDTITLPRSVVEQALNALWATDAEEGTEAYSRELEAIKALRAALEQPQSPYGECDECGTPYSYDPTDGGCICVRCMKEKLATKQPKGEQEPDAFREWWRMRPSLTRLQAWLIWKDEHKQPPRQPLTDLVKDAFFEGFVSVETYNDTRLNSVEDAWAEYKAAHRIGDDA